MGPIPSTQDQGPKTQGLVRCSIPATTGNRIAGYPFGMRPALSNLGELSLPVGLVVAGIALGFAFRHVLRTRLAASAVHSRSRGDDIIISAVGGPVVVWCSLLGLYLASQVSPLPFFTAELVRRTLLVLLVVSVTWALARLIGDVAGASGVRTEESLHSPRLVTNLVRAMVLVLGGLVVLQTLGIAITPLVTALGVTGLAVGLALQDTLANLFAGIHILLSRQVRRGDFIRLAEGQEGVVQDITWRYTTIKQISNITTTVPNSKLASAVTSIFTLRSGEQAILVPASVSYEADLAMVERVTTSVAQEVMGDTRGAVEGFHPLFRFFAMDDARVRFNVVLAGKDREAQYLIRHEFIKRLRARFREEQIR